MLDALIYDSSVIRSGFSARVVVTGELLSRKVVAWSATAEFAELVCTEGRKSLRVLRELAPSRTKRRHQVLTRCGTRGCL